MTNEQRMAALIEAKDRRDKTYKAYTDNPFLRWEEMNACNDAKRALDAIVDESRATLALAHEIVKAAEALCSLRGDVTEGDRARLAALLAKWRGKP